MGYGKTRTIKRDDHKQKWEETEFPLVCETCLGDNPYGKSIFQIVHLTQQPIDNFFFVFSIEKKKQSV